MAITLTSIRMHIYNVWLFRNGMNSEMACSSMLTSWETDVTSSCIVNKSKWAYYSLYYPFEMSMNATSAKWKH